MLYQNNIFIDEAIPKPPTAEYPYEHTYDSLLQHPDGRRHLCCDNLLSLPIFPHLIFASVLPHSAYRDDKATVHNSPLFRRQISSWTMTALDLLNLFEVGGLKVKEQSNILGE